MEDNFKLSTRRSYNLEVQDIGYRFTYKELRLHYLQWLVELQLSLNCKDVMFIHSRIFSFGLQDTVLKWDCVISVPQRPGIILRYSCRSSLAAIRTNSSNSMHCKRRKSFVVSYGTWLMNKAKWKTLELQTYIISSEYFRINALNVSDINAPDF